MGGTNDGRFKSPLQIGRMRRALALKTTRKYASGYHDEPFLVFENETWDFSIKFYQDLVVDSGATLTVKCEIQMVPQAKIIIKPGAKLILDGGRIGTDYYAKEPWQGIYVEGDRNLPQTFDNQGALIMQNGAVIENARNAVNLRAFDNSWSGNGGIVQASDSYFINNRRSLQFMDYQDNSCGQTSCPNVSSFTNVHFITNNDTPFADHTNNVSLWRVNGVVFQNCQFVDQRTNIDFMTPYNARNGIYSISASFSVTNSTL